jgi:hypothetical protein
VRLLLPSRTEEPATPDRAWIVLSPVPSDMSKVAKAPARLTPLDVAMLPAPDRLSVLLAPIVVAPV